MAKHRRRMLLLGDQPDGSFVDSSENHVREVPSPDPRLRIMELVDCPGRGYVCDADWSDIYPGPCLCWYGERGGPALKLVLDELLTYAFEEEGLE